MTENQDFVIEKKVLIKYDGPGGEVAIPNGVKRIGYKAFADCIVSRHTCREDHQHRERCGEDYIPL